METLCGFSTTRLFNRTLYAYFRSNGLQSRLVELDNGTTMHCWIPRKSHREADPKVSSEKPPLVLLHAFGADGITWGRQISTFSTVFDLYVPDLVFCGDSTSTSKERSELFQAECVLKLLQQLSVFKFSVVGTSYGGFVAYRLAHLYPHAIHKLVLSSSGVNMTPATDQAIAERFNMKDVKDILLPRDVEGVRRSGKLVFHWQPPFPIPAFICEDVLKVIHNRNRKEKLELLDALELRKDNAPPLPVVNQDVLLIWGEFDPVFDVSMAFKLKQYIGENAELEIIKKTAHAPQSERPVEYNRKVLAFLQRPSFTRPHSF